MTSLIDDVQLIEEVKKRPLLFNNRYRNCDDAKEEAWAEIAQKFNARGKCYIYVNFVQVGFVNFVSKNLTYKSC